MSRVAAWPNAAPRSASPIRSGGPAAPRVRGEPRRAKRDRLPPAAMSGPAARPGGAAAPSLDQAAHRDGLPISRDPLCVGALRLLLRRDFYCSFTSSVRFRLPPVGSWDRRPPSLGSVLLSHARIPASWLAR